MTLQPIPPIATCWCCPLCPQCARSLDKEPDGTTTCYDCSIRWEQEGQPGSHKLTSAEDNR